jgi:hypothetical protein
MIDDCFGDIMFPRGTDEVNCQVGMHKYVVIEFVMTTYKVKTGTYIAEGVLMLVEQASYGLIV